MSRIQVNLYVCKLRLLQYGLVDAVAVVDSMGAKTPTSRKTKDADGSDAEEDEDEDDLITRRNSYVKRCIREAQAAGMLKSVMAGVKNPLAMEKRRDLVKEFFKDVVAAKKCASCSGYVVIVSWSCFMIQLTDMEKKEFRQAIEKIGHPRYSVGRSRRKPDRP